MDDEAPREDLVPRQDPDAGSSDLDAVTGDGTSSALTAEISEEKKLQSDSKEEAIKAFETEGLPITASEKVSTDTGQFNGTSGDQSLTSDHRASLSVNDEKESASVHEDLQHSKKEAETSKAPMSLQSSESMKTGPSGLTSVHATGHDSKIDHSVKETKKVSDGLQQKVNYDAKILARESCEAEGSVTVKFEAAAGTSPQIQPPNSSPKSMIKYEAGSDSSPRLQTPNAILPSSQSNQEKFDSSVTSEKSLDKLQPRRNPESCVNITHAPAVTPEKPSEDGFNWRKYGQKLVKGNEFVRSYYRCTYLNCIAKKQVERSNLGQIIDINYIGEHEHPRPQHLPQVGIAVVQPPSIRKPELSVVSIPEGITDTKPLAMKKPELPTLSSPKAGHSSASLSIVSQFVECKKAAPPSTPTKDSPRNSTTDEVDNTSYPDLKRRRMDIASSNDPVLNKHSIEARQVVQTMSEVDLVNDGYRWRKYGQKLVKGNPNPRSYYRCSNAGCPVKKHVERASHDPKLVITTYEGQHGHDMPFTRAVNQNTAGGVAAVIGEPRSSDTGENKTNGLEMVVI